MRILVGIVLVSSMACAMEQQQHHIANKRQLCVPEGWTKQQYMAAIASGQQQARYMSEPEEQQKKQKQQMEVTTTTAQTTDDGAYALYDKLAKIGTNNDLQQMIQHYLKMPSKCIHKIASALVQRSEAACKQRWDYFDQLQSRPYEGIGVMHFNNSQMIFAVKRKGGNVGYYLRWDERDGNEIFNTGNTFTLPSSLDHRGNTGISQLPNNHVSGFTDTAGITHLATGTINPMGTQSNPTHIFRGSLDGPYVLCYYKEGFITIFDRNKNEMAKLPVSTFKVAGGGTPLRIFDEPRMNVEFCAMDGKDYLITMDDKWKKWRDATSMKRGVISFRDMHSNELFEIAPQGDEEFKHFMCYENDQKEIKLIINTENMMKKGIHAIKKYNLSYGLRLYLTWQRKADPYQLSFLRLLFPYMSITRRDQNGEEYHLKLHLNKNDHALALKTLNSFDKAIKDELMEYIVIDDEQPQQQGWYDWAKSFVTDYME